MCLGLFPAIYYWFLVYSYCGLTSRHCLFSVIFSSLWYVLWPRMWSVMVNVLSELEKNVLAHCWMTWSVDVRSILVIDRGVQLCPHPFPLLCPFLREGRGVFPAQRQISLFLFAVLLAFASHSLAFCRWAFCCWICTW